MRARFAYILDILNNLKEQEENTYLLGTVWNEVCM